MIGSYGKFIDNSMAHGEAVDRLTNHTDAKISVRKKALTLAEEQGLSYLLTLELT